MCESIKVFMIDIVNLRTANCPLPTAHCPLSTVNCQPQLLLNLPIFIQKTAFGRAFYKTRLLQEVRRAVLVRRSVLFA